MTLTDERRRAPRYPVYLPVQMRPEEGKLELVQTLTKDLAMGGMRCLSLRAMPSGAILSVQLSLRPGEEPLLLTGRTVWSRPIEHSEQFDLGVSFGKLPPQTQRRLSTYLERVASHQRRVPATVLAA